MRCSSRRHYRRLFLRTLRREILLRDLPLPARHHSQIERGFPTPDCGLNVNRVYADKLDAEFVGIFTTAFQAEKRNMLQSSIIIILLDPVHALSQESSKVSPVKNLSQNENVSQFLKFIIIGLSSTMIDFAIQWLFYFKFHTPLVVAKTISFTCAVSNGFFWNSRWTFKGLGSGKNHELYMKFVSVNLVGLMINMTITAITAYLLVHRLPSDTYKLPFAIWLVCFVVATGGTFFWNFTANKLWTFKKTDALLKAQE